MSQSLAHLAPHSRVWIFQADRFLTANDKNVIEQTMGQFIPQWASHGNELYGGFDLKDELFLVIGVDEAKSPASGCSIDSLTRVVKDLGAQLNIDFFNRLAIAYVRDANKIDLVSMSAFKQLYAQNLVNENTVVFNNLVANKEEFDTKWQTPVHNSWHSNIFQVV